jgi:hypothetical protein
VRLQSVDFPATAGRCMTFWYHALGVQVGQLNVYVRDISTSQLTKAHGIAGDQGSAWKQANVHFTHSASYKVCIIIVITLRLDSKSIFIPDMVIHASSSCPKKYTFAADKRKRLSSYYFDLNHACQKLIQNLGT